MLSVRFCAILRRQLFFALQIAHYYIPAPPGSAPFIIFVRERFQYSLFGQNMLLLRFHTILRRKHLSCAQSRTLISSPSQERSSYNFRARPFPIFVNWPKYATCVISRDFESATFFACPVAYGNIAALLGALLL